ncbi:conserved exported hypothetical protein [Candidatus Sulfopaludibacter sp. SbA6]|nr:conserved exported hypothetical protein [Candidatus Sulfopaludibacter sp. SbA6]
MTPRLPRLPCLGGHELRHNLNVRLLAITCCLLAASAAPADPWGRIRSDHFELFTTAGERSGRDLIQYLEQVRGFFLQAFDLAGPRFQPVRIVWFRTDKEYRPYRPTEIADAFFQPGIDHDYIVMKTSSADLNATAVHEYIHLLVRETRLEVPHWLDEGLAELYSNLEPMGSEIVVGKPILGRVQTLARERWIDLRTLVGPGPISSEKNRAAMFYAESWALIHMLSLDRRYSSRLRAMFDALQNGDTPAAFQKAYGGPIENVEQDLRAYTRGDAFNTAVFDLRLPDATGAPRVEPDAVLPARLALAELLSNDRKTLPQAAAAYKALAREYENRWEVEDGWGEFCARERKNDEAARHFARAAGLGCDNARMYLAYGRVLNMNQRFADAIGILKMGLRLDPTLDDLHFELAVTLVHTGSDRDAVAEFHRIKKLDREYAYRYFYNLAVAHSRLGDTGQARRLIEKAREETKNPEEIAALGQLMESLNRSR